MNPQVTKIVDSSASASEPAATGLAIASGSVSRQGPLAAALDHPLPPSEFWLAQLEHGHARNALVDGHRFTLLTIAAGFHGVVIGSLAFGPGHDLTQHLASEWYRDGLAIGIGMVGLGLFSVFYSQHLYMRQYKRWIAACEERLLELSGLVSPVDGLHQKDHKGSYYHDNNDPDFAFDRTIVPVVLTMGLTNCGVASLCVFALGASYERAAALGAVFAVLHVLVALYTSRWSSRSPIRLSESPLKRRAAPRTSPV